MKGGGSVESIYATVGRKIQKFRSLQSMTQQELAERSGLSVPFVSQIETGNRKASLDTYQKLAAGFGIELWELFREPTEKKIKKSVSLQNLNGKQKKLLVQFLKSL
jgi:transcriptional regulator with XRE-family HTH domain